MVRSMSGLSCWSRGERTRWVLSGFLVLSTILSLFGNVGWAAAAAELTVTPITWNVVGLDSNKVSDGPNNFPVGARICNTGDEAATTVTATFVWDDGLDLYTGDPYINLRTGSLSEIALDTPLAPTDCRDVYFEVTITRDKGAYDKTRRYHIEITADAGLFGVTPTPREIYVEYLVSQSRNATTGLYVDGVPVPAGGAMTLEVGGTYNIMLTGSTAPEGYEQLEMFVNFANTIFQINSVTTVYGTNTGTDPAATTKLYADGCQWDADPTSTEYLSCLSTGKYGGDVSVTYNVTIIGGAGSSETLTSLIYDFSGSSFHYNSDFSADTWIATIIDAPTAVTLTRSGAHAGVRWVAPLLAIGLAWSGLLIGRPRRRHHM